MRHRFSFAIVAGLVAFAVPALLLLPEQPAPAADHLDPPLRTDIAVDPTPDIPADIADVYVFHTGTSFIVAVTFAGPQATTMPAFYDRDVLYTINIANGPSRTVSTFPIRVRFGVDNSSGTPQFGARFEGLPGVNGAIEGPVETDLSRDGVTVRAGLFDDPFFFDLVGFRASRSTGTLAFNPNRNFFAGQNLTAIVMEIPRDRIENGNNLIGVWATTARFGGQR